MNRNDEILDGLDGLLDGIDETIEAPPTPAPAPKKPRAKASPVKPRVETAIPVAEDVGEIAGAAVEAVRNLVTPPLTDPMAVQHGFSGRKLRIIIDRGHGKDDPTTVFLRLNNYEATAPRGVPIDVYEEVVAACLDNAVQTVYSQPTDGELIPSDALRFSYRAVR